MTDAQLELFKAFLPLLLGVLTIIGGLLLYGRQKALDRKNEILKERRILYRKFVGLAQQLQTHRLTGAEEKAKTDYSKFKIVLAELLVTAPDHVVEPLKGLDKSTAALLAHRFGGNSKGDHFGVQTDEATLVGAVSESFASAIEQMRLDSFSDSKFTTAFVDGLLSASISVAGVRIK